MLQKTMCTISSKPILLWHSLHKLLNQYPNEIVIQYISIIGFFTITLYGQLYARVGSLLTCGKQLHNRIISLGKL